MILREPKNLLVVFFMIFIYLLLYVYNRKLNEAVATDAVTADLNQWHQLPAAFAGI